jgi:hypothetical protein
LEERQARIASVHAGAEVLKRFATVGQEESESAVTLRKMTVHKLERLQGSSSLAPPHLHLRLAMIAAEREAVISMRDRNEIGDSVMRRLQQEFDHEEVLLHQRYG